MKKEDLIVGSHVDFNSPDYFLGAIKIAVSYGSTAFSFYTGAPQNKIRKPIDQLKIEEGLEELKNTKIDQKNIVVHAPYIINLATPKDDLWNYSIDFIVSELIRTNKLNSNFLVLHPGNFTTTSSEAGIKRLADALNIIFEKTSLLKTQIAIETMSGKGTEIGKNFEEIKSIINLVKNKKRISVCLDTCHTWDAGYNWNNGIETVLNEFDKIVGLSYLSVIHLNNSKNILNSKKDRHENLLTGKIDKKIFIDLVWSEKLISIPKILETPYVEGKPIYQQEIKFLFDKGN